MRTLAAKWRQGGKSYARWVEARSSRRKAARRRADHLGAVVCDLHDGQAPLIGSVGLEAEHPVSAVEARYVGQRRLIERIRSAIAGERGGQPHRVIRERRTERRSAGELRL